MEKNSMVKETQIIEQEYLIELQKIKNTISQNQNKTIVMVNSTMLMTYYEIGTIINQRKVWGNKYVERLSNDLKIYGKGFSYDNLNYMRKFSSEFSFCEIFDQPGRLIPWRTMIEIIKKSHSHEEMLWYINQTHKNGWSRSMIITQIAMKAYERSLIEPTTTEVVHASNDELVNELFKDTYVFEFLNREKIKQKKI